MKTSHIYPGANTLNAYINIKGCNEAIEFYKKAFYAKEKLAFSYAKWSNWAC